MCVCDEARAEVPHVGSTNRNERNAGEARARDWRCVPTFPCPEGYSQGGEGEEDACVIGCEKSFTVPSSKGVKNACVWIFKAFRCGGR